MNIGNIQIDEGAFLAPMAGVSNPPYRLLCREMGAALCVTQLVAADVLVEQGPGSPSSLGHLAGEAPFAVQLYGRHPESMARAAEIAVDAGAEMIDLNFGCPTRRVVQGGEGAGVALMREPDLLRNIARTVIAAVGVPVTAKIRIGYSKDDRNAPYVARLLEEVGIQAICVHARWRNQEHSGPVDLATLAEVVEGVSVPVIGNGGIRTRSDAKAMIRRTGCARVAVGTAAMHNPWIFQKLTGKYRAPTPSQRVEVCRRHLQLLELWAQPGIALREMREHARRYLEGVPGAEDFLPQARRVATLEEFDSLLAQLAV